jgi:hypothetical protein
MTTYWSKIHPFVDQRISILHKKHRPKWERRLDRENGDRLVSQVVFSTALFGYFPKHRQRKIKHASRGGTYHRMPCHWTATLHSMCLHKSSTNPYTMQGFYTANDALFNIFTFHRLERRKTTVFFVEVYICDDFASHFLR